MCPVSFCVTLSSPSFQLNVMHSLLDHWTVNHIKKCNINWYFNHQAPRPSQQAWINHSFADSNILNANRINICQITSNTEINHCEICSESSTINVAIFFTHVMIVLYACECCIYIYIVHGLFTSDRSKHWKPPSGSFRHLNLIVGIELLVDRWWNNWGTVNRWAPSCHCLGQVIL